MSQLAAISDAKGGQDRPFGRYGMVPRWIYLLKAFSDTELTRSDIYILMFILNSMNPAGEAWPGMQYISNRTGLNRTTVVRSIRRLVKRQYLVRESGCVTRSNRYRMAEYRLASGRQETPTRQVVPKIGAEDASRVGVARLPEHASTNLSNNLVGIGDAKKRQERHACENAPWRATGESAEENRRNHLYHQHSLGVFGSGQEAREKLEAMLRLKGVQHNE